LAIARDRSISQLAQETRFPDGHEIAQKWKRREEDPNWPNSHRHWWLTFSPPKLAQFLAVANRQLALQAQRPKRSVHPGLKQALLRAQVPLDFPFEFFQVLGNHGVGLLSCGFVVESQT
jgi:hypothetical protein